ncbi:MAG TPA: CPBP family intramembrane glutamic endopeptidase, partial [Pirellulales bacterium]|nr:CPBP family intramembrane glutamic endopeptidase [Pirellulales bacterium]
GGVMVPFEPRRPAPWTGVDLASIALVYLASNAAMALFLTGDPDIGASGEADAAIDPARMPALLMTGATVSLATLVAAVVWIRHRRRADWTDLGLDLSRLPADLFLGLAAFAVVSVPIYAMQTGLTKWYEVICDNFQLTPSEHPIVNALRAAEPGWGLWLSSLVSAVLVAPVVEEFLFRVLLQGWLESLGSDAAAQVDHGPMTADAIPSTSRRPPWAPIVLSSAVFALMHLAHGADVVPLFFFALALGYLYRQTHRLWPSMVVHVCLNACTLGMLWLGSPS